jgi:hypothetical protein
VSGNCDPSQASCDNPCFGADGAPIPGPFCQIDGGPSPSLSPGPPIDAVERLQMDTLQAEDVINGWKLTPNGVDFSFAGAGVVIGGIACAVDPVCDLGVVVVGGVITIYVAYQYLPGLIQALESAQTSRLITVQAKCSVHENGTPNHASAGVITATGQGTTFPAAAQAAYSAAQAAVFAQYGIGFHAQHCHYTQLN